MSRQVPVRIKWHSLSDGGRRQPFLGQRYLTVVKFDGWPEPWESGEHWSVIIDFDPAPRSDESPATGTMRFLSDDGPHEVLSSGADFELYEGSRCTAEGEILEDNTL